MAIAVVWAGKGSRLIRNDGNPTLVFVIWCHIQADISSLQEMWGAIIPDIVQVGWSGYLIGIRFGSGASGKLGWQATEAGQQQAQYRDNDLQVGHRSSPKLSIYRFGNMLDTSPETRKRSSSGLWTGNRCQDIFMPPLLAAVINPHWKLQIQSPKLQMSKSSRRWARRIECLKYANFFQIILLCIWRKFPDNQRECPSPSINGGRFEVLVIKWVT